MQVILPGLSLLGIAYIFTSNTEDDNESLNENAAIEESL